jgi:hypothetical protein
MWPGDVGEERRVTLGKRPTGEPLVKPEGGGGATHNAGACNGTVEREAFPHNAVEEGRGRSRVAEVAP